MPNVLGQASYGEKDMQTNLQLAIEFKNKINAKSLDGGYVIIYNNEAVSWMATLHDPRRQAPGCIAIDEHGVEHIATGGNDYDGAESWEPNIWQAA